ncbi:hypothetical protein CNR22_10755 [Sphingobacteriaceae bacterium]|nr:hypothetical protein CNR22_10755 [Sphingobacteriaceae bacterium]
MRLIFILAFCMICHVVFSQTLCKGRLIDVTTNQPIEFANIGVVGKALGTVSNERGEYSFTVPDSLLYETLKISMIGYKSESFSVKEFQKHTEIKLTQSATVLNEVAVSVKKTKIKILGNDTKTKSVSAGFKNNSLGAELGIKLSVKHPQTHIRKVMFNINTNTLDKLPIFRLNIYKVDKQGNPAENILTQNIIISPAEKTGYIAYDLNPYGIFVDDDVIISIEWIKDLGDAKGLYFSTKMLGSGTYYRQTSQAKWEKIASIGIGLHAEIAY